MKTEFKVVVRPDAPYPSWASWKSWTIGRLSIHEDNAEFLPKKGAPILIEHVTSVAKGWRNQQGGRWIPSVADNWIEVAFGASPDQRLIYLNDPRFLLMATCLPHKRLITALATLIRR